MDFEIGKETIGGDLEEITKVAHDFRENYCLKPDELYIIEKQASNIAPHFVIYPESNKIEIKDLLPKKSKASHIENTLMDNEKQTYVYLNGNYFMILKQNPNSLGN